MIKYKDIKFNGSSLDKITGDTKGFIVTDLLFRFNSKADTNAIKGRHGSFSSPTYVRSREIIVNGIITAETGSDLQSLVNEISDILSIDYTAEDEGTKDFEFTDDNSVTWIAQARVKQLPNFKYRTGENEVSYSCILFCSDPIFTDKNNLNNKRLF